MAGFREGYVYKLIAPGADDPAAETIAPNADDRRDGFLHLSTGEQVMATAEKYYADHRTVILRGAPAEALGDDLRWEASRGGVSFPHLYGEAPMALFDHTLFLVQDADGFDVREAGP